MIDLNIPFEDELVHHGVKGQKWGVTRVKKQAISLKAKTKSGENLDLVGNKTPLIAKALGALNKKIASEINKNDNITINNSKGKKVGNLEIYRESKDSMNVVWIGVNKKHEGQGYAQASMKAVIDHAKKEKLKHVTLEVPGISPNARHVYEKMGFKAGKTDTTAEEWGGLTDMKLDLKHMVMPNEDELMHHGVKGQKWGVRRDRKTLHTQRKADTKASREIAKKNKSDRNKLYKMSDSEIKKRTDRMNLEINYHNASEKQVALYRSRGAKSLGKFLGSKQGKKAVGNTASKALNSEVVQSVIKKAALMAV